MKTTSAQRALALHDRALNGIRNIETLVGLMEAIGDRHDAAPVNAVLVGDAAGRRQFGLRVPRLRGNVCLSSAHMAQAACTASS